MGNKVDAQNLCVSCVCGTTGLAKSIGLGKLAIEGFEFGERNINIHSPSINPNRLLLLPVHIKLGLMKQFVKALNKGSDCLAYLHEVPCTEHWKVNGKNFDGPQMRRLIQDKYFPLTMTTMENMLGGPLQQLSKTSSEILKLTITTFHNSC